MPQVWVIVKVQIDPTYPSKLSHTKPIEEVVTEGIWNGLNHKEGVESTQVLLCTKLEDPK